MSGFEEDRMRAMLEMGIDRLATDRMLEAGQIIKGNCLTETRS